MFSRTRLYLSMGTGELPGEMANHNNPYEHLMSVRKNRKFFLPFRAITATRLQGWMAAAGILLGASIFIGPWLFDQVKEMLGYKFTLIEPGAMAVTSPEWWENEWRKMNPIWRVGESVPNFFVPPFEYVLYETGRDLFSAEDFRKSAPGRGKRYFLQSILPSMKQETKSGSQEREATPKVLVPLCGDSPIIATFARAGYDVDAIDSSETALRSCSKRTEQSIPQDYFKNVHLHWLDFFSPELWSGPLKDKKFDIIYERQAMTSLNRDQRSDYAYLLKQALKSDGIIYVEGIFRTGRVKGNKQRGPPYSLSRKDIEYLFPADEGFFVRCEEKNDAISLLSREDRILRRIPKSLYVTPFHCAVFKEKSVNSERREEFRKVYEARPKGSPEFPLAGTASI